MVDQWYYGEQVLLALTVVRPRSYDYLLEAVVVEKKRRRNAAKKSYHRRNRRIVLGSRI